MDLQEIINRPKEVRVVASTNSPIEETEAMIGGEYAVLSINYKSKTVNVLTANEHIFWSFNLSDVRELTPLSYNGKRIAISDEVKWFGKWVTVYGYYWSDGRFY